MDKAKEMLKNVDKKTLKVGLIGVGGLILLIVLIFVIVRLTEKTYDSYEGTEEKLIQAAERYYKDHSTYLPQSDGSSATLNHDTLAADGYIKPLKNLLRGGAECSAYVVVTKIESSYDYAPYLNCGSKYSSVELYKKVLEDNKVVTEGAGIYKQSGTSVFRGEVKNNFVMLNNNLWRILRIESNNNLVLVSSFRTIYYSWDDRYNEETLTNYGINNYDLSRIKETIEEAYYSGTLLTESERNKIVNNSWCLGTRTALSQGSMAEVECSLKSKEPSPIGLITMYEYMNISLDDNCNAPTDRACTNYNFMHDLESSFWTITKSSKDLSFVYSVLTSGVMESRANSQKQIRYVIHMNAKTMYSSGSGTEEDPYKIR